MEQATSCEYKDSSEDKFLGYQKNARFDPVGYSMTAITTSQRLLNDKLSEEHFLYFPPPISC